MLEKYVYCNVMYDIGAGHSGARDSGDPQVMDESLRGFPGTSSAYDVWYNGSAPTCHTARSL